MEDAETLSASEAAAALGVNRATLYAYVSRGLLRSAPSGAKTRSHRYSAEDVRALKERRELRKDPGSAVTGALSWGAPILESSLTLIRGGRLFYRGIDACALATSKSIEEVAGHLWLDDANAGEALFQQRVRGRPTLPHPLPRRVAPHGPSSMADVSPIARFELALAGAADDDLSAHDLSPLGVAATGARIMRLLAVAAARAGDARMFPPSRPASAARRPASGASRGARRKGASSIVDELARGWGVHGAPADTPTGGVASGRANGTSGGRGGATAGRASATTRATVGGPSDESAGGAAGGPTEAYRLLNAALVLCADHELNVSAFAARTAASALSPPYHVVLAGLAALAGPRHGGATHAAESLIRQLSVDVAAGKSRIDRHARTVLRDRMASGERIPGFGHPLYPHGDPRGRLLLNLLSEDPAAGDLRVVHAVARIMENEAGLLPNFDFALGALATGMGLPEGAAVSLFAIGRTVGWIAHAIEQYGTGKLIRPRATYVGRLPS